MSVPVLIILAFPLVALLLLYRILQQIHELIRYTQYHQWVCEYHRVNPNGNQNPDYDHDFTL